MTRPGETLPPRVALRDAARGGRPPAASTQDTDPTEGTVTDTPVRAWHGDPALKADTVERMRAHAAADEFTQRSFLVEDKAAGKQRGCFHGCLAAEKLATEAGITVSELAEQWATQGLTNWWAETARLFGFPIELCSELDDAYEDALTVSAAAAFAVAATEAIPVGADLSAVADQIRDEAYEEETAEDEAHYDRARILELLRSAPVPALVEG